MIEEKVALHDLNNMLTVIAGMSRVLQWKIHELNDAYLIDKISLLVNSVERAMKITRGAGWDFIDERERVTGLKGYLSELKGHLELVAGENVECLFVVDNEECFAEIDPVELDEIVINLVENAVEAMDRKGRLSVLVDRVYAVPGVCCSACGQKIVGDYAVVGVTDTGPGIRKDATGKIWSLGYTTKPARSGKGLYRVRTTAHLCGGHVVAKTSPEGTVFRIYLPLSEMTAAPVDGKQPDIRVPAGKKALVDVGDGAIREILGGYLTEMGISIVNTGTSDAADVVICDPDVGTERARQILRANPKAFALCITNHLMEHDMKGRILFLVKPFDRARFSDAVKLALAGHGEKE